MFLYGSSVRDGGVLLLSAWLDIVLMFDVNAAKGIRSQLTLHVSFGHLDRESCALNCSKNVGYHVRLPYSWADL